MTVLNLDTAIIAIAKVQTAYCCSALDAITLMQSAAAKARDEQSLEVLCEIKGRLIESETSSSDNLSPLPALSTART